MRATGKYVRDSKTIIVNFPDQWGTVHIEDAAITNSKIANLAVTNAKIGDLAVTNAKINDLSAAKITTGSLAVTYTDAKCTDANADQTSANPQTLGWLTGSSGTLTLSSNGKLAINAAGAFEVQAALGMKVIAGADIYLVGHNSNAGTIIFDGVSYDTIVGCKADGTDFGIGPAVTNSASGMFGKTYDGNVWFSAAIWGNEHIDLETANYALYFDDSEAALRPGVSGSVSLGNTSYKFNQGWFADNLTVGGVVAIHTTIDVNNQLKVIMSNTAANNYGIVGGASGAGTNNIGIYASATNADTSNHHFEDASGNYSDATGPAWHDGSHSGLKSLITDLDSERYKWLYDELVNVNIKSYRANGEIPIIGYSETEIIKDPVTGEESPLPIYDDPVKAPERFGLIADDPDIPEFMSHPSRKGLAAGRLSTYALACIKHQKSIIEQLDNALKSAIQRIELLEVT